jgi:hypothetical protein
MADRMAWDAIPELDDVQDKEKDVGEGNAVVVSLLLINYTYSCSCQVDRAFGACEQCCSLVLQAFQIIDTLLLGGSGSCFGSKCSSRF